MKVRVAFAMTLPDGSIISNSILGTEFELPDFPEEPIDGDPADVPSITVESGMLAKQLRLAADLMDSDILGRIPE